MKNVSGIYLIVCKANGKKYVGSSVKIRNRINSHKSLLRRGKHRNSYLQNTFNKYGADCLEFSILEETSDLESREAFWIKELNTMDKDAGYNFEDPKRRVMSQETKDKIRRANTGKKFSAARKKAISEGKKKSFQENGVTNELRDQLAQAREDGKHKVIAANKSRIWTDEMRENHSAALKGKKRPPRTAEQKENYRSARLKYLNK